MDTPRYRIGPEFDAAIAEQVMGWNRWDTYRDQANTEPVTKFYRPDREYASEAPPFSRDIEAAIGMVEQTRIVGGWHWTITGWADSYEVTAHDPYGGTASAKAPSLRMLPAYLCLVALRVKAQARPQL